MRSGKHPNRTNRAPKIEDRKNDDNRYDSSDSNHWSHKTNKMDRKRHKKPIK